MDPVMSTEDQTASTATEIEVSGMSTQGTMNQDATRKNGTHSGQEEQTKPKQVYTENKEDPGVSAQETENKDDTCNTKSSTDSTHHGTSRGHREQSKSKEVLTEIREVSGMCAQKSKNEEVIGTKENTKSLPNSTFDSTEEDKSITSASDIHQMILTREELIDKIKGVIYGQAIGDAYGLATEFMSKKEAHKIYGEAGPSHYADIYQDHHRRSWKQGDWTDDTDQMLLILQMITESGGLVDCCKFAQRMKMWMYNGFKDLGDKGGCGIGMTVYRTMTHKSFLSNPHKAAKEVWESSGCYLAANGAVMRTSILGVLNFNDLDAVRHNTEEICKTTHADPRCLASCIAVTTAIALMLQGKFTGDPDGLTETVMEEACRVLTQPGQKEELKEHMQVSTLQELKLDEENAIGYTFKAVGAGFYGLRSSENFMTIIKEVTMEAGDADTNGAVCGALVGCQFGFSKLPREFLEFPHRKWLDQQVERFLKVIEERDQWHS